MKKFNKHILLPNKIKYRMFNRQKINMNYNNINRKIIFIILIIMIKSNQNKTFAKMMKPKKMNKIIYYSKMFSIVNQNFKFLNYKMI